MPFGRYKGQDLNDIPFAYLDKLIRNVPIKSEKVRAYIDNARQLHCDINET